MADYPHLAALLARFPEFQMFRKFDRLSILMLLYLQADLVYLEQELEVIMDLNNKSDATRNIEKCWETMRIAFREGRLSLQQEKIQEIQDKLKTYHEVQLRMTQINNLSKPATYSHKLLGEWLTSSQGGNNFLDIFEASPWQSKYKGDLVSLTEPVEGLDRWLARYLTPVYHFFGRHRRPDTDPELGIGEMWEYKNTSFVVLGNFLCVFLSSGVPLASVFVLFFVTDILQRLLLITAFTIVFTCILGLTASCRRSEIFAATAAFVAVQVVFLQGVIGIHQND